MEVILALPFLLLPFAFPLMAGYTAKRFGRNFWFWFFLSFPLPLVSCFIVVCLPDKSSCEVPVEDEEIFKELNGIS